MSKVTISKEVAEAIKVLKERESDIPYVLEKLSKGNPIVDSVYGTLTGLDIYTIMSALVNGYEVEKSPEEKLREFYTELRTKQFHGGANEIKADTIQETLNILGITIEDIND